MIAIPGTSNRVDLTDSIPGGLTFGSRTGSWQFYIDHSKWDGWEKAYNIIKNFIHGNRFLIVLQDEPLKAYQGVCTIGGYVSGKNYSKITIQYDLSSDIFILNEPLSPEDMGLPSVPNLDIVIEDGKPKIDTDGDGDGDIDLKEGVDDQGNTIYGYDVDCDGTIDIVVNAVNPIKPQYIYSEDATKVLGLEVNNDGEIDYYVITDDNGREGLDLNCDGKLDIITKYPIDDPQKDPDSEPGQGDSGEGGQPIVVGSLYPIIFIANSGESDSYGVTTVSNSSGVFGVYDLHVLYQQDVVTPNSLG